MAKVTPLGIKRNCPTCNERFYDLNKKPAECPKCGHSYDPEAPIKVRRARKTATESKLEKGDVLLDHVTKNKAATKSKRKEKEEEEEKFEGLEKGGLSEDLEELDDMDDIEGIEEIEDISDDDDDELDEDDIAGESLIDKVEDEEEDYEEEEDEEDEAPAKPRKKK